MWKKRLVKKIDIVFIYKFKKLISEKKVCYMKLKGKSILDDFKDYKGKCIFEISLSCVL